MPVSTQLMGRLNVLGERPVNAEPNIQDLTSSYITPVPLIFARNHSDYPIIDETAYRLHYSVTRQVLQVLGKDAKPPLEPDMHLSIDAIKSRWRQHRVIAVLECAGNRRSEMNAERKTEGIAWGPTVIANVEWGGPLLRDLIISTGFPDPYVGGNVADWAEGIHVHFESHHECTDDSYYGSSIPLATALSPIIPVVLAHSHNGEPLAIAGGFPLRVVIPGHIGARSVKWLDTITVKTEECRNFYHVSDYKLIIPKDAKDLSRLWDGPCDQNLRRKYLDEAQPIMEMAASCVIASPGNADRVTVSTTKGQKYIHVRGYAVGQEGSPVSSVHVTLVPDLPSTVISGCHLEKYKACADNQPWTKAYRVEREDGVLLDGEFYPSQSQAVNGDGPRELKWGWSLWDANVQIPDGWDDGRTFGIVARSETASGKQQPRKSEWNLRGVDNRGWSVIQGLHV